ncbi:MAG TPA: class I SAM-dependent methyltransferase [Candidatus Saccharimonadales bacterium]|nr:class I SAM-dependent methyltransferase [Candidatus Saccharimonadales bacterium]
MTARDWDAATYDRISFPQARWGGAVLDRLPLAGDERVLDAGCGSGRVTEALMERLPHGSAIALDASAQMLEAARTRLARFGDRVSFVRADLGQPLPIAQPVDAILSTATFHWVLDHDALFRNLAAVLLPGGRLVAQCGGHGNIASVMRALDELGETERAWNFATADETRSQLEVAGFTGVETWLQDEPTPIPAMDFETFLTTVVLGHNLERRAPGDRRAFVRSVIDRLPGPHLDYVRLNIVARRA